MVGTHSHIGKAAIQELNNTQTKYRERLWSSTSGYTTPQAIIDHGPKTTWEHDEDLTPNHSNWLPQTIGSLIAGADHWVDLMSLSPPNGMFLTEIKKAIGVLVNKSLEKEKSRIVVRILFGNVIGVPINCHALIGSLTEGLSTESGVRVWVGAWRRDMCWNHAKIVAVDGQRVYTGGHNLWDDVYLQKDPIHDTSILLKGEIAHKAHLYANDQWAFIKENQNTVMGWIIDKIKDDAMLPVRTRVTISEWPEGPTGLKKLFAKDSEKLKAATTFAPLFDTTVLPTNNEQSETEEEGSDAVPMLALGRYGNIGGDDARSSDKAFIAMFDAAQKSIRLLLQDLGPVNKTMMGKKIVYKSWPKEYMKAFGRAMFERGVDVEIVLSNTGSGEERGNYSNGWSCEETAAEIIKAMRDQYPNASPDDIKKKVVDNLRVCFLRNRHGNEWYTGSKVGLHSKFFIVDDVCTYVGSQNLYMFDLAEWGVAIDDEKKTAEIMDSLWKPMWHCSYLDGSDCDDDKVMDILDVDRDFDKSAKISDIELAKMEADINLDKLKKSKHYKL